MPTKKKQQKKTTKKRSHAAKAVAREVIETVGKGRKVKLGEIVKKHGYSPSISKTPQKVTETKSFQEEIDPFVKAMLKERDAALKQMAKTRNKAKYRDLTDAIDKLTKNAQLLTGKGTDNLVHRVVYIPQRKQTA